MSIENRDDVTLPDGYCLTTIGEVVEDRVAQHGPTRDFTYLDIGSVDRNSKTFLELKTVALSEAPSRARQIVQPWDVLVSMTRPNLNAVAMAPDLPGEAVASTGFHVLRSPWVEPKLLFYLVQTEDFIQAMTSLVQGALYPAVRPKDISSYQFGLPPRDEQSRIVEKLEELLSDLDVGMAELEAALHKLMQYRQSLLKAAVEGALTADWRVGHDKPHETGIELLQRILSERRARWEQKQLAKFADQGKTPPKGWQATYPAPSATALADPPALPEGWTWASLGQLVAESSYGTSVKCSYEIDGDPVLRIPNVGSGKLDLQDMKFATEDLNLDGDDYIAVGDVLVIRTNGSIGLVGQAAVVTTALPAPHYFASYLLRLRCVEASCTHRWISIVLASHSGRRWIEERAASSAGQHNISLSTLLTMPVPLPPISEQAIAIGAIEKAMESAEQHENAFDRSLRQAAAQRKNLLKAAFAGQLVPEDPNDEPASALLERIRRERSAQPKPKRIRKMTKSSNKTQDGGDRIRAWIESRDFFTFDELKREVPAPYQALKDSLFSLLAERPPTIEQEFASSLGIIRFRRIKK